MYKKSKLPTFWKRPLKRQKKPTRNDSRQTNPPKTLQKNENYKFLQPKGNVWVCLNSNNNTALEKRQHIGNEKQPVPNIDFAFISKLRKNQRLRSFIENIMNLSWTPIMTNKISDLLCFACQAIFQFWHHLMFQCTKLARITETFNIRTWMDVLQASNYANQSKCCLQLLYRRGPKYLEIAQLSIWKN